MNKFEKLWCGITGIASLIVGGSSLVLSKIDRFSGSKKTFQIVGSGLMIFGVVLSAIFADSNLYPEDDEANALEDSSSTSSIQTEK